MGRLRGFVWLFAGLVVAGIAGLVAYMTLTDATARRSGDTAGPLAPVVVASRPLAIGSQLGSEDLEVREIAVTAVPQGAISQPGEAVGMVVMVDMSPGEIVLARRLVDPNVVSGDGRVALALGEDEVLVACPADDLLTSNSVLKPGDRVDVLVSLEFEMMLETAAAPATTAGEGGQPGTTSTAPTAPKTEEQLATFTLLENVGIAAILGVETEPSGGSSTALVGSVSGPSKQSRPLAILFAVRAQDALVLKYARDWGGIQDIALRAPGVDRPFGTDPVDAGYMINRYRISATPR